MKILYHGKIYTQDPGQPFATALLIDQGRILAVGRDHEILSEARTGCEKVDLQGQTVWPGLVDSHIHLGYYSLSLKSVVCETDTLSECLKNVQEVARQTPPGAWIQGWGWNQNVWAEGFGTAQQLDKVAPNNPVYLQSKSGHSGWTNSIGLQKAGITAQTPDPEGGKIQRTADGQPTGIFFETAMNLIDKIIPPSTVQEYCDAIEVAQKSLWKTGITGICDFDGISVFAALQKLYQEGRLQLRVQKGIPVEELRHAVDLKLGFGFGNDILRIGPVKMFADGALGPQTAAMLTPYENTTDDLGILLLTTDQVLETGKLAAESGLPLAIHAIGDLATREVINGYALLRAFEKGHGLPALRHRVEHAQLLHPDDLVRLAQHNIIASMQPIHTTSDLDIADRFWGKRSAQAYAFKSLVNEKTVLAFGSDAPVEVPNPFVGLHAAVTRRRANGDPGPDGWYPEQRLTLQEALAAYTIGAAYTSGRESYLGRLAGGYLADLIVLELDPFALPAQDLHKITPKCTMVAGEWVWQS